jgi:hypothetical protein
MTRSLDVFLRPDAPPIVPLPRSSCQLRLSQPSRSKINSCSEFDNLFGMVFVPVVHESPRCRVLYVAIKPALPAFANAEGGKSCGTLNAH